MNCSRVRITKGDVRVNLIPLYAYPKVHSYMSGLEHAMLFRSLTG